MGSRPKPNIILLDSPLRMACSPLSADDCKSALSLPSQPYALLTSPFLVPRLDIDLACQGRDDSLKIQNEVSIQTELGFHDSAFLSSLALGAQEDHLTFLSL